MFEKDLKLWVYFDRYGALLSPKKREVFEAYYGEDLSLAEIAGETGTSRQAVQDLLRRTCEELKQFEKKLELLQRREACLSLCERLEKEASPEKRTELIRELKEIL